MLLEKIKALWPIQIKPIIDGINVIYYSDKTTFTYKQKSYTAKLGKKTYRPVVGRLTLSPILFNKINYARAKENLGLFNTLSEAILYLLKENKYLEQLIFIAEGILDEKDRLIKENILLRQLGYSLFPEYTFTSPEESYQFLEAFSLKQTQNERSAFLKMDENISFAELEIKGEKESFVFHNETLAFNPCIIEVRHKADGQGVIKSHFKFEEVKLLDHVFNSYVKEYGELTTLTLVNHTLYDLTTTTKAPLTNCPTCGVVLKDQLCPNYYCKSKVIERAHTLASREGLNIRGLSKPTLCLIYDYLKETIYGPVPITSDVFFFGITSEDINHLGLNAPQAKLLNQAITQACQKQKLSTIIMGLKMPGINKVYAQTISKAFKNDIHQLICYLRNTPHENNAFLKLFKSKMDTLKQIERFVETIY